VSLLDDLNGANLSDAVAQASRPERIRGFGHVKEASVAALGMQTEAETKGQRFAH
jgi:indolepyruvate ferredoxin oxidoreductase